MLSETTEYLISAYCGIYARIKRVSPDFQGKLMDLQCYMDRYAEPWRYQHTSEHIVSGLRKLYPLESQFSDPVTVLVAWLYHDIIWAPKCEHNEWCSAEFAQKELMRLKAYGVDIKAVYQMIIATHDHVILQDFCGNRSDLAILLDVDLSDLGAPHEEFMATGELIRKEFGMYTRKEFTDGRAAFAQSFLNRDKIFMSTHFEHLEDQAQKNLTWAVAQATYRI